MTEIHKAGRTNRLTQLNLFFKEGGRVLQSVCGESLSKYARDN